MALGVYMSLMKENKAGKVQVEHGNIPVDVKDIGKANVLTTQAGADTAHKNNTQIPKKGLRGDGVEEVSQTINFLATQGTVPKHTDALKPTGQVKALGIEQRNSPMHLQMAASINPVLGQEKSEVSQETALTPVRATVPPTSQMPTQVAATRPVVISPTFGMMPKTMAETLAESKQKTPIKKVATPVASTFGQAFERDEVLAKPSETVQMQTSPTPSGSPNDVTPFFDEDREFMSKVDEAWLDTGSSQAKRLTVAFCSLLVIFVAWAGFAAIDEVARGQGQVVPSQRVQLIQHLEGGILDEVLVREGETVVPGQILARVDNVGAASQLRDTQTRILETRLAIIRLNAEIRGISPKFPAVVVKTHPFLVRSQINAYNARRSQWENSQSVFSQQVEQKTQELNELLSRRTTYGQALGLVRKRVELATPLVERKLYAEVDFLNLQQEAVRIQGDIAAVANNIAKTRASVREAEQRKTLGRREFESSAVEEMNAMQSELSSLEESQTAGKDRVTRTELRSQVRGIVNKILLNTKGGVVKAGENIMEIVPLDDTLLVEAKISPKDIAFIHANQKAVVKITAYDSSIYGSMEATVEQISADTTTTERGDIFFLVKVRTKENAIHHKGEVLPIMPGMVASVDILTGKKTVLAYLLKPITRASQYALRER